METEEIPEKLEESRISGLRGTAPLTLVLPYPGFLPKGLGTAESSPPFFEAQLESPTTKVIIERDFPIGRRK